MGSYDNRSQKIAQSFAHVMNVAGVNLPFLEIKRKTLEIHHVVLEMNFYSKN